MLVERFGYRRANAKREEDTSEGYHYGETGVAPYDAGIYFESNDEQEETEPDVSNEREVRDGCSGEYVIRETWDATERGGTLETMS